MASNQPSNYTIATLMQLTGKTKQEVLVALSAASNNPDRALEYLLSSSTVGLGYVADNGAKATLSFKVKTLQGRQAIVSNVAANCTVLYSIYMYVLMFDAQLYV